MKNYPKGTFSAKVINLRKKDNRYFLFLELDDDISTHINIDIHDSICETAGVSSIPFKLKEKIFRYFPTSINVTNIAGYWEILNETELLSNVISRAL